jgi:hypothetical protein
MAELRDIGTQMLSDENETVLVFQRSTGHASKFTQKVIKALQRRGSQESPATHEALAALLEGVARLEDKLPEPKFTVLHSALILAEIEEAGKAAAEWQPHYFPQYLGRLERLVKNLQKLKSKEKQLETARQLFDFGLRVVALHKPRNQHDAHRKGERAGALKKDETIKTTDRLKFSLILKDYAEIDELFTSHFLALVQSAFDKMEADPGLPTEGVVADLTLVLRQLIQEKLMFSFDFEEGLFSSLVDLSQRLSLHMASPFGQLVRALLEEQPHSFLESHHLPLLSLAVTPDLKSFLFWLYYPHTLTGRPKPSTSPIANALICWNV